MKDSDAAQLKQREIKLGGELEEAKKEADHKKRQEQEKEERYREIEGKQKKQQ